MAIYIFFFLTPVILHFFVKEKKLFRNIMIVVCFLLLSLRSMSVGADIENYYTRYNTIFSYDISYENAGYSEPLFFLLNWLCGIISGGSFHFFVIVCAALFSILYSHAIYLLSSTQWLSWYLTVSFSVLVYAISGLRSSFGLIYGLISVYYLGRYIFKPNRKDLFYSVVFGLLGTLHHYSAIIYLVIIPLYWARSRHKKLYYFTIMFFIVIFLSWGSRITTVMKELFFASKIYDESSGRGFFMILIILLMIISMRVFIKREKVDSGYSLLMCLLEVSFAIQVLAFSFSLWVRVAQYTLIASLIMIPNYLERMSFTKGSKLIVIVVLCVFFLGWYVLSLVNNSANLVPYSFFWDDPFLLRWNDL